VTVGTDSLSWIAKIASGTPADEREAAVFRELGKLAATADLWLLHIRGHANITANERCDYLAGRGRKIQEEAGTEQEQGPETMRRARDRVIEYQRRKQQRELETAAAGGSKGTQIYMDLTNDKCLREKPAARLKAASGDPAADRAMHQARMGFFPRLYHARTSYAWKDGGAVCAFCGTRNVDVRHVFLSCKDERVAEWRDSLLTEGELTSWTTETTPGISKFFSRLWYGERKQQDSEEDEDTGDSM
jgi:hypothetical protein